MAWYNSDSIFRSVYLGFIRHCYQDSSGDDFDILGVSDVPVEGGGVVGTWGDRYDGRGQV